jgi:hypothetical protein
MRSASSGECHIAWLRFWDLDTTRCPKLTPASSGAKKRARALPLPLLPGDSLFQGCSAQYEIEPVFVAAVKLVKENSAGLAEQRLAGFVARRSMVP